MASMHQNATPLTPLLTALTLPCQGPMRAVLMLLSLQWRRLAALPAALLFWAQLRQLAASLDTLFTAWRDGTLPPPPRAPIHPTPEPVRAPRASSRRAPASPRAPRRAPHKAQAQPAPSPQARAIPSAPRISPLRAQSPPAPTVAKKRHSAPSQTRVHFVSFS